MMIIEILLASATIYILLSFACLYLAHALPRNPVVNPPDWGNITDIKLNTRDSREIEVWRIEPDNPLQPEKVVVLAHGWGRNRDRMVDRARMFGKWGYTTVIHSARDHGGSSPKRFMNAPKFAEDIETVIRWIGKPVILYGHSAGAAGAIIAASRMPENITHLFMEGSYADPRKALLNLYTRFNLFFGFVFARTVIFLMDMLYEFRLDAISPVNLAEKITCPVMIIHGENDNRIPSDNAYRLKNGFTHGKTHFFIARGRGHSDSSDSPDYPAAVRQFLNAYSG